MDFSEDGAADELEFWRDVVARYQRGDLQWLADRLSSTPKVSKVIVDNIMPQGEAIKVLDVGCGPFGTMTPGELNGCSVVITGVDPLADDYKKLHSEAGIKVPMTLINGTAENLHTFTAEGDFDFVNSDNALDHCYDPGASLRNMLRAVRPGGVVRVKVFVDEGQFTGYSGFHQWNFRSIADRIIVWNRGNIHFVDEFLNGSPYKFEMGKEFTSTDAVERETIIMKIVKVDHHSHKFENVLKDDVSDSNTGFCQDLTDTQIAGVAYIKEIDTLLIEKGKAFDEGPNLFVHWYSKKSEKPIEVSLSCRGIGNNLAVAAPDNEVTHCVVGQFEQVREDGQLIFKDVWKRWVPCGWHY